MLTSNTANANGFRVYTTWASAGATRVKTNIVATNHQTVFAVTPNPCNNKGDHKTPTAYSYTKRESFCPHGRTANYTSSGSGSSSEGYLTSFYGPGIIFETALPDNTNSVNNKGLAKLYNAIRDSEVSLNTTIGEGRETLQMIEPIAAGAFKLIRDLTRLRRKEIAVRRALARAGNSVSDGITGLAISPLQTVGGLWLAWSVGLKPLLNDVENLRNHVAEVRKQDLDFQVDARSAMRVDFTKGEYLASGMKTTADAHVLDQVEYGLTYAITDLHAFENWRLGLTVRPTLAWELATLSFVVDYFVNIGQYLELLEASIMNNGIAFRRGYKTTLRRTDAVYFAKSKTLFGGGAYTETNLWTRQIRSNKTRTKLTSFPSPSRPTVKIPTAAEALLNVAALLAQLIKK